LPSVMYNEGVGNELIGSEPTVLTSGRAGGDEWEGASGRRRVGRGELEGASGKGRVAGGEQEGAIGRGRA